MNVQVECHSGKTLALSEGKARVHAEKMLNKLKRAHKAGKRKKAAQLCRAYLTSLDARYVATCEAYRKLKAHRRPPKSTLNDIALHLDARRGTREEVVVRLVDKNPESPSGHHRTTMDYGIENRSLQYLAQAVLKAQSDLHASQFGTVGVHAAIRRVREHLLEGNVWAIETDIRDCYPSFDSEKVPSLLPLPEEVTRSVLLSCDLNLSLGKSTIFGPVESEEEAQCLFSEFFTDARRGFPQGSAASTVAVEMLLADTYRQLPTDNAFVGYADNFLAMAQDEAGAVSMSKAFWSALGAHPAGQLRPKKPNTFPPGVPIEFLGHELTTQGGAVRISPSKKNRLNLSREIESGVDWIGRSDIASAKRLWKAKQLKRYVSAWANQFKLCDEASDLKEDAIWSINEALVQANE